MPNKGYNNKEALNFETRTIKSSLCDYSDTCILVTGNVEVNAGYDTDCEYVIGAPFSACKTQINCTFIDQVDLIHVAIPVYNLFEYSNNCLDTSGSV